MMRGSMFLLGVLLSLTPAARAGDLVVAGATGTALRPGQIVDDSQTLVLKEGEQVKLIAADGSVRTLHGPYNQAPAKADTGATNEVSTALASLMTGQRSEYGVVRSKTQDVVLPNAWVVDISHSGKACVRTGIPVVFWRAESGSEAVLHIVPTDRSWRAEAPWPKDAATLDAPANFTITARRTYLFDLGGQNAAVTLIGVPDSLTNDRMRAAWMLENNCVNQTQALLKTLN